MRIAPTTTIVAAALLMAPAAALATPAAATKTTSASSPATTTTAASGTTTTSATSTVPSTSITTTTPGSSGTALPLAPPRRANRASGREALTAYAAYLQTLVDSEPTGQAEDAVYIDTVESGCKSSLKPLTESSDADRPAVQNTLTALGKELGDDLALTYDQIAVAPLDKLATVLDRLKWVHGGRNSEVLTSYITAENGLISLTQSQLCQDALLAASKPAVTPAGTRSFLTQFDQSATAASAALGSFLVLLRTYATAAERPLLQRISTLAGEFASASKTSLLSSGQQLTTSLETS